MMSEVVQRSKILDKTSQKRELIEVDLMSRDDGDGSGDGIDSIVLNFFGKKEAHLFSMRSEIAMIRVSNSWCDFFNSSRQSS